MVRSVCKAAAFCSVGLVSGFTLWQHCPIKDCPVSPAAELSTPNCWWHYVVLLFVPNPFKFSSLIFFKQLNANRAIFFLQRILKNLLKLYYFFGDLSNNMLDPEKRAQCIKMTIVSHFMWNVCSTLWITAQRLHFSCLASFQLHCTVSDWKKQCHCLNMFSLDCSTLFTG